MKRSSRSLLAMAGALALLLAACGSDDGSTSEAAPAADAADTSDPFPAFVGTTSDGAAFDLEDHRGEDIALWFWAPW